MAAYIFPETWQIPIDYKVTMPKGYLGLSTGDLTVYDASGNLVFRVCDRSSNSSPRRIKTLLDPAGNPLNSVVHHNGGWQVFKGKSWDCKDLIFTVRVTLQSMFNKELEVFLAGENIGQPGSGFRLKGCPSQRSCTIYKGDSIVAQSNLMYKLRKVFYSKHKFRLTVYPEIDSALVVTLLVIFFAGH